MFWVAKLTTDNHPVVADMKHTATKEEALTEGVALALDYDAPDDEEAIRTTLDEEGVYIPHKHAEWSICLGEVDMPVALIPVPPKKELPDDPFPGKQKGGSKDMGALDVPAMLKKKR